MWSEEPQKVVRGLGLTSRRRGATLGQRLLHEEEENRLGVMQGITACSELKVPVREGSGSESAGERYKSFGYPGERVSRKAPRLSRLCTVGLSRSGLS